ncbi:type II toxin-antitoxin system VapC family toxin [Aerophototrophica crusticola]|uniref:Ribonuclease VapC n=1 Tax=Aerophototrophica crusticola TaxID=1709002 RepID=A0A858RA30_9PROT|nr:type II toxin-antitoxin system VapC family toxin [Rhodospirillaceae bacterium B3]
MEKVAVDASVAVKWLVAEDPAEETAAALALRGRLQFVVPAMFSVEVMNVLWLKWRKGLLTEAQCDTAVQALRLIPREVVDAADVAEQALAIARQANHPVYDCAYVAAALAADADAVITADRRFARAFTAWQPEGRRPLPVLALDDARLATLS